MIAVRVDMSEMRFQKVVHVHVALKRATLPRDIEKAEAVKLQLFNFVGQINTITLKE